MTDPGPHIIAAIVISCASFGMSLAAIAITIIITMGR